MKLIKGSDLSENLKERVLSAYIYRLTKENGYPARNPCKAKVAPISDKEWLEQHAFYITKSNNLSNKHSHCEPSYLEFYEKKEI